MERLDEQVMRSDRFVAPSCRAPAVLHLSGIGYPLKMLLLHVCTTATELPSALPWTSRRASPPAHVATAAAGARIGPRVHMEVCAPNHRCHLFIGRLPVCARLPPLLCCSNARPLLLQQRRKWPLCVPRWVCSSSLRSWRRWCSSEACWLPAAAGAALIQPTHYTLLPVRAPPCVWRCLYCTGLTAQLTHTAVNTRTAANHDACITLPDTALPCTVRRRWSPQRCHQLLRLRRVLQQSRQKSSSLWQSCRRCAWLLHITLWMIASAVNLFCCSHNCAPTLSCTHHHLCCTHTWCLAPRIKHVLLPCISSTAAPCAAGRHRNATCSQARVCCRAVARL